MNDISGNLIKLTIDIFKHFGDIYAIHEELSKRHCDDDKILELILQREILISVLETLPVCIQIVDNEGKILYVNSAFLDTLNVKSHERVGKNIFKVSPDGSLAIVLKTKKTVTNLRNSPEGTFVELISNASPLYYNDKMIGAVAIMHDIMDVVSLTKKLRRSRYIAESLSEKISYLSQATYFFDDIIGNSPKMNRAIEISKNAAQNDSIVLIQGETGTGKELIANAIHNASARSEKPFISINCSAIPENLLESEFFGHEKGSFTGAIKRRLGKFELANKGTLFLDEIGEMPITLQPKILRAIQERKIQRVGGEEEISVDIRIIAATNRELNDMVKKGEFREDLYYRLNVIPITVPPLRERKEDIQKLTDYLIKKICRRLGKEIVYFDDKAMNIMCNYHWPGNVRELENIIERAIIGLKMGNTIKAKDLSYLVIDNRDQGTEMKNKIVPLDILERQAIINALNLYGNSYEGKKRAAKRLGISLATLYNKINKYDLEPKKGDNDEL